MSWEEIMKIDANFRLYDTARRTYLEQTKAFLEHIDRQMNDDEWKDYEEEWEKMHDILNEVADNMGLIEEYFNSLPDRFL